MDKSSKSSHQLEPENTWCFYFLNNLNVKSVFISWLIDSSRTTFICSQINFILQSPERGDHQAEYRRDVNPDDLWTKWWVWRWRTDRLTSGLFWEPRLETELIDRAAERRLRSLSSLNTHILDLCQHKTPEGGLVNSELSHCGVKYESSSIQVSHQHCLMFGVFPILFFPGKGKKGSIVHPHTSAEQQTGWLLHFLVGLLTNRNRLSRNWKLWWQTGNQRRGREELKQFRRRRHRWFQCWLCYLYERRSPAQVFQRSRCKTAGDSRRPLLHHQGDASSLCPQLLHQVLQLPAHLDQSQSRTLNCNEHCSALELIKT